ncbi:MAG: hypothetical protein P0116_02845 [Candidatus Nitrosocosmicus sp.]|nr:hypothetical protein [Candidatus Nitrosocosmicus sp.]
MIDRIHPKDLVLASVFTIIGLVAGPFVSNILNNYISVTPSRLAGLLEHDEV